MIKLHIKHESINHSEKVLGEYLRNQNVFYTGIAKVYFKRKLYATYTLINGHLHSIDDKPAVIYHTITKKVWYMEGFEHREKGPAVIFEGDDYRTETWLLLGLRHREDGPAYIEYEGDKIDAEEWWFHGEQHREDGPAHITISTKINEYYLRDHRMDEEEWKKQMRHKKLTAFLENEN